MTPIRPLRRGRTVRGFTLIELLIVVAMVGVLVVAGWSYLRPDPRPIDAADQLSTMVSEASRRAVSGGAVRANVATALGVTARTRITIEGGSPAILSLERLEEDPSPTSTDAAWVELRRVALSKRVVLPCCWCRWLPSNWRCGACLRSTGGWPCNRAGHGRPPRMSSAAAPAKASASRCARRT